MDDMNNDAEMANSNDAEEMTGGKSSDRNILGEWIRDIAIAAFIAFLVTLVIKPTVVKESSMEPNFYEDDYLFLNKLAYKFGNTPNKGDVIVFRTTQKDQDGKNKLFIKRVIGVPGDTIDINEDGVFINGKQDDQSYTRDGRTEVSSEDKAIEGLKVTDGMLFCMGDNRAVSIDSRSEEIGLVDQSTIVGKAVFRLLPLSKAGFIHNVYGNE